MFLDTTMRRNPRLVTASARLHAEGRIPAGCYVVDIDTVAANTRLLADAAGPLGLTCLQMTKQFGRNPVVAETVAQNGIDAVVAVELAEARVLHRHGRRIGHLGHIVQVPYHDLAEAITLQPRHVTVFGVEQARAVAGAARRAGIVQPLLLRVVGPDDHFFAAQRGGVPSAQVLDAARAIAATAGVRLDGLTSFPCVYWDEQTSSLTAAPNLATLVTARETLRAAGFAVPVLNTPGISCVAAFPIAAQAGATHVEPGSSLIGNTPWHAANDGPERPAMVYVSEVTHELDGIHYTLGGGFYARSRARAALVVDQHAAATTADVVAMPPTEIDYYGAIRIPDGRRVPIGTSVVYAFRSQVFVTRAPVAVVAGVGGHTPTLVGLFTRDGEPLAERDAGGRR
jgi:predicted amino acid racemase